MIICPNCNTPSIDGNELLRCAICGYTKELMTYEEFGKLCQGVSAITVARWVKAKRIDAIRFSRNIIRIHRSQFQRITKLENDFDTFLTQ